MDEQLLSAFSKLLHEMEEVLDIWTGFVKDMRKNLTEAEFHETLNNFDDLLAEEKGFCEGMGLIATRWFPNQTKPNQKLN